MATVKLRFYGRFVYGRSRSTGKITVMAPVFDAVKLGHHDTLMSVRRDDLDFKSANTLTFEPKIKVVSDAAEPLKAEVFVWDLTGRTVTYAVDGPVSFETVGDSMVLDLAELETLAGRPGQVINPEALTANPDRRITSTIVEITAGDGVASVVDPTALPYLFVTERDSASGTADAEIKDGNGKPISRHLADLVDFTVTLPTDGSPLTLTCVGQYGSHVVTVKAGAAVGFSNICAKLPHLVRRDDLEFSQYYNLLRNPPGDLGIIPREPEGLGGGSDCDVKAQIEIP